MNAQNYTEKGRKNKNWSPTKDRNNEYYRSLPILSRGTIVGLMNIIPGCIPLDKKFEGNETGWYDITPNNNILSPDVYGVKSLLVDGINNFLTRTMSKNGNTTNKVKVIHALYGENFEHIGDERTLEDVGRCFNITKQRVNQIEKKFIKGLRKDKKIMSLAYLLAESINRRYDSPTKAHVDN